MMAQQNLIHIWRCIEPAVPDCLEQVEPNIYEARWWKPVPADDLEILCCSDGIDIIGEPYEPKHLPSGIAVRFCLKS